MFGLFEPSSTLPKFDDEEVKNWKTTGYALVTPERLLALDQKTYNQYIADSLRGKPIVSDAQKEALPKADDEALKALDKAQKAYHEHADEEAYSKALKQILDGMDQRREANKPVMQRLGYLAERKENVDGVASYMPTGYPTEEALMLFDDATAAELENNQVLVDKYSQYLNRIAERWEAQLTNQQRRELATYLKENSEKLGLTERPKQWASNTLGAVGDTAFYASIAFGAAVLTLPATVMTPLLFAGTPLMTGLSIGVTGMVSRLAARQMDVKEQKAASLAETITPEALGGSLQGIRGDAKNRGTTMSA